MLAAFLISFREVMEASFIVAIILGLLMKLNHKKSIKTVWLATFSACISAVLILAAGSLLGFEVNQLFKGENEELFEGIMMVLSAFFITWAVFSLHKYLAQQKAKILKRVETAVEKDEQGGIFLLTFVAVLREGLEIVLFLSTIFFSTSPGQIFSGFLLGFSAALLICITFVKFSLKLPVKIAFRFISIFLILFAAGLLARGIHEFMELGFIPEFYSITLSFIPHNIQLISDFIKVLFGITRQMDVIQIFAYSIYSLSLGWYIFFKPLSKAE